MQSNRAPLRRRPPLVARRSLGVLAAACTILIVVSLGFVHPSESGAWSIDWIVQTVTGESVVAKDTKGWLDYDFGRGQFQGSNLR